MKLSWSSMYIPTNLTNEATSTTSSSIKNCLGFVFRNHVISSSTSNVMSLVLPLATDFTNDGNVLSSAKLCTGAFLMQKKKPFKNAINNIGPTTEPCGTPEIMSLKSLQIIIYLFPLYLNSVKNT